MLRWTVIESDGVPGTMRSSAFHIVPNKSIPQNVILGRDWLMKEAFVSGASVAEKPPSRPCTEVPFNGQWRLVSYTNILDVLKTYVSGTSP